MTIRGRWIGGLVLGLTAISTGVYLLIRMGLEDADRWASVLGLVLNVVGLAITIYSLVRSRHSASPSSSVSNHIADGEFDDSVKMARNVGPSDPQPGDVRNTIRKGRFHGPVIMGRDITENDQ
jgi:hypothetical protein